MINIIQVLIKLKTIFVKNIKRLMESKISASLILFGPLILIFLLGLAFQSSGFFGVTIGVYSPNYNEVSQNIISAMQDTDFTIIKEESSDTCINGVKEARTHLCMQFPEKFEAGRLAFYVDYSRLNLVYAIISKINSEIGTISENISMGITQDLLNIIGDSSAQLTSSEETINQLKLNAIALKIELYNTSYAIRNMNITQGSEIITSLTDNSSTLLTDVTNVKDSLVLIKSSLESTKTDSISASKNQVESQLASINTAQTNQGCTPENSRDLTPYLASENLLNEMMASPNPTCAILFTMRLNLEDQSSQLDSIETDLDVLIDYMSSLHTGMSDLETTIYSSAQVAKQNINSLDDSKMLLSQKLEAMALATDTSIASFDIMNEQLSVITNQFEQLSITDPGTVIKPIKTFIKPLSSKKINTLDIIYPSIIVMVLMFVGLLMGNILVMREKTSRAYFRNLIIPVKDWVFILGTYLTTAIIALTQVAIIIIIGTVFFGTHLDFNVFRITPILFFAVIIFSSIGMIIGYLTSSEETSVMAAIILTLIFLLFSNMIIPIETMEETIGIFARLTPFNISEMILRRSLVFGSEISSTNPLTAIIFTIQLILLVIGVWYSHKYSNKHKK